RVFVALRDLQAARRHVHAFVPTGDRWHRVDVRSRLPVDALRRGPVPPQKSLQSADLDSVRRLARPLLYFGTAVAVLAFAKEHAALVGHYSFHSSSRLPWTLAYIGLLCLAAYA